MQHPRSLQVHENLTILPHWSDSRMNPCNLAGYFNHVYMMKCTERSKIYIKQQLNGVLNKVASVYKFKAKSFTYRSYHKDNLHTHTHLCIYSSLYEAVVMQRSFLPLGKASNCLGPQVSGVGPRGLPNFKLQQWQSQQGHRERRDHIYFVFSYIHQLTHLTAA